MLEVWRGWQRARQGLARSLLAGLDDRWVVLPDRMAPGWPVPVTVAVGPSGSWALWPMEPVTLSFNLTDLRSWMAELAGAEPPMPGRSPAAPARWTVGRWWLVSARHRRCSAPERWRPSPTGSNPSPTPSQWRTCRDGALSPDHEEATVLKDLDLAGVNDMTTAGAALTYAGAGLPVFPVVGVVAHHCSCPRGADCQHPAKHPLVAGGQHAATTQPDQIRFWWSRWPWANVGMATGASSGLVTLDVDPRSGGAASLKDLRRWGMDVPASIRQHTGGGGAHLLYAHPGTVVPNSAGHLAGAGETPGLDLRGDGGYVLVAPSRHISGRRYRWDDSCGELAGPAPLPAWLQTVERP